MKIHYFLDALVKSNVSSSHILWSESLLLFPALSIDEEYFLVCRKNSWVVGKMVLHAINTWKSIIRMKHIDTALAFFARILVPPLAPG